MIKENKFLITVNFSDDCLFAKKVSNFRKRFISGPETLKFDLPLWAPFRFFKKSNLVNFADETEEEIHSYFISDEFPLYIKFKEVNFYKHKKKYLLYLVPDFSVDFQYCFEGMAEIKKKYTEKLRKEVSPYLLLGSFFNEYELQNALEEASKEFSFPVEIAGSGFSIHNKVQEQWREIKKIILFDQNHHSVIIDEFQHKLVV